MATFLGSTWYLTFLKDGVLKYKYFIKSKGSLSVSRFCSKDDERVFRSKFKVPREFIFLDSMV